MINDLKNLFKRKKNQQLFVHIGMPKTGSSAIQAFLTLNKTFLGSNNFSYPNDTGFKQAFQTSAGNVAEMRQWIIKNNTNKLENILRLTSCQNIILSSEILFVALKNHPREFAEYFKDKNIKIICYVREINELLESCINQQVKNHYLVNYKNIDKIIQSFDYFNCLVDALKYLPRECFIIRKYGDAYYDTIYKDFFDVIGIELDDSVVYPEKHVNPSFNRDALEFRIILNKSFFGRDDVKVKYRINGLLAAYSVEQGDSKRFELLTEQERKEISKNFEAIEKKFIHEFFAGKLKKLFTHKANKTIPYKGLIESKTDAILAYIKTQDLDMFNLLADFISSEIKNLKDKEKMLQSLKRIIE